MFLFFKKKKSYYIYGFHSVWQKKKVKKKKKEKENKRIKTLSEMMKNQKGAMCTSLIQLLSAHQPK